MFTFEHFAPHCVRSWNRLDLRLRGGELRDVPIVLVVEVALLVSGSKGAAKSDRCRPYRAERSPDWIKVKNRSHPALNRVKESFS